MTKSLLIINPRSGSFDEALVAQLETLLADAGQPISRKLALGEADLPTAQAASAEGLDLIIILSGDGSISAAADALAGWDGTVLVLPGGTMNLLAGALHGDLAPLDIVQAWLAGTGARLRVPMIRAGEITAYAGIIAGPTALWGDVREDLRNLDLAALGASVPRALGATLDDTGVRLAGQDAQFPAIYLEPSQTGIEVYGIQAASAADLFRHGLAWLQGDFRDGPSERLGNHRALTLSATHARLDMLVDGEQRALHGPLDARLEPSPVQFHAAQGAVIWR
ncbi:MAG TPA: diacylglycerol kinase family protein [Sphingobium sp.]|nr:diacylglycerol kinase family protein [Sphingobium sp.]